jgi:hypothetical protein
MEKQLLSLKETHIGLQARLEETQQELVQTQQNVAPLLQEARASEEARQEDLVMIRRLERCLDIETIKSLRRREERDRIKAEKRLLSDENQLLRDALEDLKAHQGPSFEDGYFTACYEVATALPPSFDLKATLNWDRGQIMAKAARLAGGNQEAEAPPQEMALPGQETVVAAGVQQDGAEGADLDPPVIEKPVVDPESASGVVFVEGGDGPARSGVPMVEGIQSGSSAMEAVHNDAATEPLGEGAVGQGEHPEEEQEA